MAGGSATTKAAAPSKSDEQLVGVVTEERAGEAKADVKREEEDGSPHSNSSGQSDETKSGTADVRAEGREKRSRARANLTSADEDKAVAEEAQAQAAEENADTEDEPENEANALLMLAAGHDLDPPPQERGKAAGRGRSPRGRAAAVVPRTTGRKRTRTQKCSAEDRDEANAAPPARKSRSVPREITSTSVVTDTSFLNAMGFPGLFGARGFGPAGFMMGGPGGPMAGLHGPMFGAGVRPMGHGSGGKKGHSDMDEVARQRAAVMAAEEMEAKAFAEHQLTQSFLTQILAQRNAAAQAQMMAQRGGSDMHGYFSRNTSGSGGLDNSLHSMSSHSLSGHTGLSPHGLFGSAFPGFPPMMPPGLPHPAYGGPMLDQLQDKGKGKKKAAWMPSGSASRPRAADGTGPDGVRRRKRPGPVSCRDKIWALFTEEEQASMVSDALSAAEGAKLLLLRRVKQLGVASILDLPEDDDWGIDYKLTECKATSEPLEKPKNCSICQRENAVFHRHSYYCRRCAQLYRAVHRKKSALQNANELQQAAEEEEVAE